MFPEPEIQIIVLRAIVREGGVRVVPVPEFNADTAKVLKKEKNSFELPISPVIFFCENQSTELQLV